MKINSSIYIAVLAGLILTLSNSCIKEDVNENTVKSINDITFNPGLTYGTMTDQDGNDYKTITIGTQTWMAENLRTTRYRNGDPIPNVTSDTRWGNLGTGAYCNYNNDTKYSIYYGRLYNWYAVNDNRNLAPAGWHVPSDAEWQILLLYLDSDAILTNLSDTESHTAGGKLKETGTRHWLLPNSGATNETGFTALPGGGRFSTVISGVYVFSDIGYYGSLWSSTLYTDGSESYTSCQYLNWNTGYIDKDRSTLRSHGLAVRCIKDKDF